MSSKVPVLSGNQVIKAFSKEGYYVYDQKGSHIHLRHSIKRPLTIPNHNEISRGTLRAIIREAGLTPDEFMDLI
jgi:predicted RNA binding protein YcfA (HicA-like mRNA interferase family)